jgi:hypothetical protein
MLNLQIIAPAELSPLELVAEVRLTPLAVQAFQNQLRIADTGVYLL